MSLGTARCSLRHGVLLDVVVTSDARGGYLLLLGSLALLSVMCCSQKAHGYVAAFVDKHHTILSNFMSATKTKRNSSVERVLEDVEDALHVVIGFI